MSWQITYGIRLQVIRCCHERCNRHFAMDEQTWDYTHEGSGRDFYCPMGHRQHWVETDADLKEQLRAKEAQLIAAQDQTEAAVREAEDVRVALLRDRQRFVNGVCPCCNRSFPALARHMQSKHPDYDITKVKVERTARFQCSCGHSFATLRGLRIHQGHMRPDNWATTSSTYWSHKTVV